MRVRRWQADLALVGVTLVWGTTFVVVKQTLESVGPLVLIAGRFWIATVFLLAATLYRRPTPTPQVWRDGFVTGLFLTLGFVTQTVGLQTTAAGKAAFITGLSVVLVPLIAALVLRQPPSWPAALGVLLATVGMGLLTLDRRLQLTPGDLWVLACAVAFALHILATGRWGPQHDILLYTLIQLATVAVFATSAALFLERGQLIPPPRALPALVYTGALATALIFGTQTWAQHHTTATHTALIFSLEPVFAALFAALLLNESLAPKELLGGALILVGMLAAEIGDAALKRTRQHLPDVP
jgi:drug/metabolite transporter (DMT)-like permease